MKEVIRLLSGSCDDFWKAVTIYYEHPNSINKQIIHTQHVFGCQLPCAGDAKEYYAQLSDDFTKYLRNGKLSDVKNSENFKCIESVDNAFRCKEGKHMIVRQLFPKHNITYSKYYEFFILDKDKIKVTVLTNNWNTSSDINSNISKNRDPLSILKYNYIEIEFTGETLTLSYDDNLSEKGTHWLRVIFLSKFTSLMLNARNSDKKSINTLPLVNVVDVVDYYKLYEEMKLKYANVLIQNWTENTDPKKFVYEDIGIATYLLLLWSKESVHNNLEKKQKFVDLGCGNGLLVHILNSEGHEGIGLDMRKRKIWDTYDSATVLKEEVIIPTENTVYPEADWLIGNHSDELTPWLPLIAHRSNNHCQYFVLPCCPYQLNGQKFNRQNSGVSSYQDFINYVKDISNMCGFETLIDKLRIPSTKRVCLIGLQRRKTLEETNCINEKIKNFINQNCQSVSTNISKMNTNKEQVHSNVTDNPTVLTYKVREPVDRVRNCTKLENGIIDEILKTIMNLLLEKECKFSVVRNDTHTTWNRGGKLRISDLVNAIRDDLLKKLKSECKGLQTLLKNHHFLFQVSKGEVQFRSPEELQKKSDDLLERGENIKWKKRNCWFNSNHPDGCPLSDNKCSYNHE